MRQVDPSVASFRVEYCQASAGTCSSPRAFGERHRSSAVEDIARGETNVKRMLTGGSWQNIVTRTNGADQRSHNGRNSKGANMPVLRQGSSGPDVTALQQRLKDLGFDPNGVDGNFGPGTRDAVIAFQQSKGLQADGIAGPATLAALQPDGSGANADGAAEGDTNAPPDDGGVTDAAAP